MPISDTEPLQPKIDDGHPRRIIIIILYPWIHERVWSLP